jgi:hypothetical protein
MNCVAVRAIFIAFVPPSRDIDEGLTVFQHMYVSCKSLTMELTPGGFLGFRRRGAVKFAHPGPGARDAPPVQPGATPVYLALSTFGLLSVGLIISGPVILHINNRVRGEENQG